MTLLKPKIYFFLLPAYHENEVHNNELNIPGTQITVVQVESLTGLKMVQSRKQHYVDKINKHV